MRFKDFMFLEDIRGDPGARGHGGSNVLNPSDAYDWKDAYSEPAELGYLIARWKIEKEDWGRKFYNLNLSAIKKQKFTTVGSTTMPTSSGPGWKHTPDKRSNLKIDRNAELEAIGMSKTAELIQTIKQPNKQIDNKKQLNQLFGEFKPKYYELPKNFDKPWKNKVEKQ